MNSSKPRAEHGFTMVELIVVMMIVAVLLGVGIQSLHGSRATGSRAVAVATARAYEQAVDRFASSHGGRVPTAADWETGTNLEKGPVAIVMGEKRFYMRSTPESIQDGRVEIGVGSTPTPAAGVSAIGYIVDGSGYRIEVRTPNRPDCAVYGYGAKPGGSKPIECGS